MILLKRLRRRLKKLLRPTPNIDKDLAGIDYWQIRAKAYGKRAVLNIGHSEDEIEDVTQMQKRVLYPILKRYINGNEQIILDFGCGPGRFTPDLANLVQGKAIGVDPISHLIEMATPAPNVEYRVLNEGNIPLDSEQVDIVWICLVLGVIVDPVLLDQAAKEIHRVLKRGGLLFLIENTAEKESSNRFKFRSVNDYQALFPHISLDHVSEYTDLNEQISVMAGRKHA